MGSDRARVSYDDRRQWRLVPRQQGRVSLEADENEADFIAAEELRRETYDIVGTCGTPDDGFKVLNLGKAGVPPYELILSNGTMYVGGVRAFSFEQIKYSAQSDWLDWSTDPDYVLPDQPAAEVGNELIYLFLKEQEVSAAEDTALRDFALGGPDSSQRTRLIQRIVRFATEESECARAMNFLKGTLRNRGLNFIDGKMRLESQSSLKVVFQSQNLPPDLCAPEATGGYLKPDNQLIRIKVVESTEGGGKLIWGFDDASFIYRVQPQGNHAVTTLKLLSRPIDEFHRPHTKQFVEVLRSAAHLSSGPEDGIPEVSNKDFAAAADGIVVDLANDYDQDLQTITLNTAIPDTYTNDPNPLFVRVWESVVAFQQNVAVNIGDTGMQVIISTTAGRPVHPGDFWMVAVRPGAPADAAVYPERYLHNPQPPDGPRMWICPLAVVNWLGENRTLTSVQDCRNQFEDLVDLSNRPGATTQTWPVINAISWHNDQLVGLDQFNSGLVVTMSSDMVPWTITEQTFQLTLDVPSVVFTDKLPPTAADLFRTPFVVRGIVKHLAGNKHSFRPTPPLSAASVRTWLENQNRWENATNLVDEGAQLSISLGIRCRVVLKGDTIFDFSGRPLDGEAFGKSAESGPALYTELTFPSGNDVKGGDFNSWFFVAPAPRVASIDPAAGAQVAPCNVPGPIRVTFTQPVSGVNDTTFTVTDHAGTGIPGNVTVQSQTQATFTPANQTLPVPPAARGAIPFTFTVTLDGNQIMDPGGNKLEGDHGVGTLWTSSFQVLPITGIHSVSPSDGQHFPPGTQPRKVVISFTAPVDLSQVDKNDNFTVSTTEDVQAKLKADCTKDETVLTLDSLTGLPTTGNFMLRIVDAPALTFEDVEVTKVDVRASTVTCVRGQLGTAAIAHKAGAATFVSVTTYVKGKITKGKPGLTVTFTGIFNKENVPYDVLLKGTGVTAPWDPNNPDKPGVCFIDGEGKGILGSNFASTFEIVI